MTGRPPQPEDVRFWKLVEVRGEDECWPWLGSTVRGGYGQFRGGAESKFRMWKSHVFAHRQTAGPPPDENKTDTLHSCDNPPCCNPKHLFYGDDKDNSDDKWNKGRGSRLFGNRNGMSGRRKL